MTRKEEKLKAADEYVKSRIKQGQGRTGDVFPAFIEGAEWADANPDGKMLLHVLNKSAEQAKKQMIEKACEWLLNHNDYLENPYANVISFNMAKLVADFRKAANEKWIEKKK